MINCIIQFNSSYAFWIKDVSSFTLTSEQFFPNILCFAFINCTFLNVISINYREIIFKIMYYITHKYM